MENKTISGHLENPFKIASGKIKEVFKEVKGAPFEMADVKTGEVSFFQKVSKITKVTVDTANYVKIYKGNADVVYKLTHSSLIMLHYIINEIGIHTDRIILDSGSYCDIMSCSDKTFRRSVNELIDKGVIAKRKGSSIEYFVNPNFIFNGSRLKL